MIFSTFDPFVTGRGIATAMRPDVAMPRAWEISDAGPCVHGGHRVGVMQKTIAIFVSIFADVDMHGPMHQQAMDADNAAVVELPQGDVIARDFRRKLNGVDVRKDGFRWAHRDARLRQVFWYF